MKKITLCLTIYFLSLGLGKAQQDTSVVDFIERIDKTLTIQSDSNYFFRHIMEALTLAEQADQSLSTTLEGRMKIRALFEKIYPAEDCFCCNMLPSKDSSEMVSIVALPPQTVIIDYCTPACQAVQDFLQKLNKTKNQ